MMINILSLNCVLEKIGYNKTVTETYKPVVEKCGQGAGSCFISQKCD